MLLHDLGAIFAQVQTPTALKVTLVNSGQQWWKDFVVPAATLTAALLGVVVGARLNRQTMSKLEAEREARVLAGERRQAAGALRVLISEFQRVADQYEYERDSSGGNPLLAARLDDTIHIRDDDRNAIAMCVSDPAWRAISLALEQHELRRVVRAQSRELLAHDAFDALDADRYRTGAAAAVERFGSVSEILTAQLRDLESDLPVATPQEPPASSTPPAPAAP